MSDVTRIPRPKRWDAPFDAAMTEADAGRLLARPEFAAVEQGRFPKTIPLAGILQNDARIVRVQPGDIVVREGDYGNSAFLVLAGRMRVVLAPGLPSGLLGRREVRRKGLLAILAQVWKNRRIPEVRDTKRYETGNLHAATGAEPPRVFLQDVPGVLGGHRTTPLEEGALFGELAALGRVPRTATVFAESPGELLEIRWQGLRELRKFDPGWRRQIDERYRETALLTHLRETPSFRSLDETGLKLVAQHVLFESYGTFDWHTSYNQLRKLGLAGTDKEPVIARQGDYPDGLLLIRTGFARVSTAFSGGNRTLTYLGAGDSFGFEELYDAWQGKAAPGLRTTLTALGYIDLLRVPAPVMEQHVFPRLERVPERLSARAERPVGGEAFSEWAIDERFINATQAMLIDLDRCTRCDDCVRACAATHEGNPRFVRQGKSFDHWMVAHACMHCADPVCMIGCPTGAIHRTTGEGVIVVNDDTCIGCGVCSQSCPYDNIRMVEINDSRGKPVQDPETDRPIFKATKCDLCADQWGGPACVRACPHDALRRVDFKDVERLLPKGR